MMKNKIKLIAAVALAMSVNSLCAQPLHNHIKGAITVGGGFFMSDHSYGGTIGDTYWFNDKISLDSRLNISGGKKEFTKFMRYAVDNQICYNFYGYASKFYVDGVAGVQIGVDNMKSKVEDVSKASFMCLAELGCKCKYFINYQWTVWFEAKERAGYSKMDKFVPQLTLGGSWLLDFKPINNRKFN